MLRGEAMDFTYHRDGKHVVSAWGQTPNLKEKSVFERECVKIGEVKRDTSLKPFVTSPCKSNTCAGDILVSSKMAKGRKDDIFCFGQTEDAPPSTVSNAAALAVKKTASYVPSVRVSPNKKRKRISDSYQSSQHITSPTHNLPADISKYINLSFSLFLILIAAYILLQLISTIHHDMDLKIATHSHAITQQVSTCANEYSMNRCEPLERLPAMQQMCSDWELCMLRDPAVVSRLSVAAETIAEVLNKLVDPLSLKALIVSVLGMFGGFWVVVNGIVGFRRKRNDIDARNIHSNQPIVFNLHQPTINGRSGGDANGVDRRIE